VSDLDLVGAVVAGVAAGGLGALVPALIARIPEPEPDEPDEPDEGEVPEPEPEPKVPYAEIAAGPGLAWRAALASLVSGAAIGAVIGLEWPLLYLVPLVPVGVALAVVDWRTRLLPTKVIAPTYVGLVAVVLLVTAVTGDLDDLERAGLGWLLAGGLYFLLWLIYPRGMGYGDVRLSGVLGIALGHLGWSELVVGIYGGFLLGGILGGVLAALSRVDRKGYPFGPFMLLGALVGVVVGQPVIDAIYA
jgi:leader peptidase (prepilin peptidase)/N-methyltransferase